MTFVLPPCYYRISVKAIIRDEEGKFLLCKEDDGRRDLPGGGLDHGEGVESCLRRELLEEMGGEVSGVPTLVGVFTCKAQRAIGETQLANILMETTVTHLSFTPSPECVEIGFFTYEEARKLPLFENVYAYIDRVTGV